MKTMKNIKKLQSIFIIFIFFDIFFAFNSLLNIKKQYVKAENSQYYYAKVEKENCSFFSNPVDLESYVLFTLPYSYFVKLTDKVDDNFYKALYQDILGYVKISDFCAVDGTPNNAYFYKQINVYCNFNLYSSPDSTSNNLASINSESTIYYIGTKVGENLSGTSNIWYYVSYFEGQNVSFGYIYSLLCKAFYISTNEETFNKITYDIFDKNEQVETDVESMPLISKILIIIGITIPCLAILYLLIRPNQVIEKTKTIKTKAHQVKTKKRHSSDYFEFDEKML